MDNPPGENKPPVIYAVPPSGLARVRWWGHLLILSAYPIALGLASWSVGPRQGPALGHGWRLVQQFGIEVVVFGIVFGLAWLLSRANVNQLLLRWRRGAYPVLLGIGYSVALRFLIMLFVAAVVIFLLATGSMNSSGIEQFFTKYRPTVENLLDVSALRNDPVYFILTSTVVSFVLGGLREEIWRSGVVAGMRVLWPAWFGSRIGQIVPVCLAAVIFGIGHLSQGPFATILTAVLGLGLGIIMVFHKSVWPAVIAHGMFDATSMALLPWAMQHVRP